MVRRLVQLGLFLMAIPLTTRAAASDMAILHNGFSIRHEHRQVLGTTTRLYTSADDSSYVDIPNDEIEHFEKDLTPTPAPVEPAPASSGALMPTNPQTVEQVVNHASDQHLIDADLINSVIHAESNFNPRAVSRKGAQGLMQLMPQTATQLGVPNAFDPQANVDGGTRYLRWLLDRYHYDLAKALAAYNAGPERVERYRGVPPYYETQAYVARIIRDFNRKKLAEQKAVARNSTSQSKTKSKLASRSTPSGEKNLGAERTSSSGTR